MTTHLNPETDFGEVELRVDFIEDVITPPYLDQDGVPGKAYNTLVDYWRASKDNGNLRAEPDLKGMTTIIKKRRGADRQEPPGYSGTGNVVVVLYPGFRYWRFNAGTGSLEELSGRVLCTPDEAVQLVSTTSATYG